MVIEFSIKNYRSIKDRQTFSFEAEATKSKPDNVFEVSLANGKTIRLLKSAVIYGANASGKSNVIKSFWALGSVISHGFYGGAGRRIGDYEPFLFSPTSKNEPVELSLTFILKSIKYKYEIAFTADEVVSETLDYYPKGQQYSLIKRSKLGSTSEIIHKARLGKNVGNKEIDVFKNQFALSKFGKDIPNELLTNAFLYFRTLRVAGLWTKHLTDEEVTHGKFIVPSESNMAVSQKLERLIKFADTKLSGLGWEDSEIQYDEFDSQKIMLVKGRHPVYDNGQIVGEVKLPFSQESEGTNTLFDLGRIILSVLENGGVLIYDELDNSLHPKVVKMLIQLFHNPVTNPKNAQLLFATHETTLLDKDLFRTDQIWFTEKNKQGETELFSAQDFDGVREDTPFDKWYLAGKFGGIPNIEDINTIFNHA